MDKPAISAIIEITLDTNSDTYKTKSFLEVAEDFADKGQELPRDVLLGLICELDIMSEKVRDRAEVTDKEMKDYMRQRKLISSDTINDDVPKSGKKRKKDAIDQSIDHLFDDEDSV